MIGPSLDPAGRLKMGTLEEASIQAQRLHGLVERMALAHQKREPLASYFQQFRRTAPALVSLLKAQFGMVADHVSQLIVVSSRSGSDPIRVRTLREGMGQLKLQIEIAANRVREQHAVSEGTPDAGEKAQ